MINTHTGFKPVGSGRGCVGVVWWVRPKRVDLLAESVQIGPGIIISVDWLIFGLIGIDSWER